MKKLFLMFAVLQFSYGVAAVKTVAALDLANSTSDVEFRATGWPMIKINGKLSGADALSGNLTIEGAKLTGLAKVKLENFKTGLDTRDGHMRERLETAKFPTAEMTINNIVLPEAFAIKDDGEFKDVPFTEELFFHGERKTVTGTVSGKKSKEQLEFHFQFCFPFTEYKVEQPSFAGITVNKDVTVNVKVVGLIGK